MVSQATRSNYNSPFLILLYISYQIRRAIMTIFDSIYSLFILLENLTEPVSFLNINFLLFWNYNTGMKWFVAQTTCVGKKNGVLINQMNKLKVWASCSNFPGQNKEQILKREKQSYQNQGADGWQLSSKIQFSKLPQL